MHSKDNSKGQKNSDQTNMQASDVKVPGTRRSSRKKELLASVLKLCNELEIQKEKNKQTKLDL
jgi:hypothetical protein